VREAALVCKPAAALRRGDRPAQRPAPGQFPQAFSHLALINAVMHVIRAESGATNRFEGPLTVQD